MSEPKKSDPVTSLISDINGSCRHHIMAGIRGNIPPGWYPLNLIARATFRSPAIAVFVDCYGGGEDLVSATESIGAKFEIDPPFDLLMLADELARQMSKKIGKLPGSGAGRVRIALSPEAIMPTRGTEGASGYDLYSPVDVQIRPSQVVVIHSGVSIELPDETWEGQIRPRSGMTKRGLWVSIGTVDSDYRGVIGATVVNLTNEDQKIKRGDRYAQLVIARVGHPGWDVVDAADLGATGRGTGGFGSTGT